MPLHLVKAVYRFNQDGVGGVGVNCDTTDPKATVLAKSPIKSDRNGPKKDNFSSYFRAYGAPHLPGGGWPPGVGRGGALKLNGAGRDSWREYTKLKQ